jgi:hypothetical protein
MILRTLVIYLHTKFHIFNYSPVSIAERSKSCTAYDRSNIGIAGSNPARGMDVFPRFCVVLSCVGRGLALD